MQASVIVATRNRSRRLARLLGVLERQTLPRPEFEVIVVDDASTDDTASALSQFPAGGPFEIVRLAEQRGPAAARNAGVRVARGEVVAFTDDDCVPANDWLAAGVAAIRAGAGVVMGRTRADASQSEYGRKFARTMEVDREDGRYPTCNVFYSREALRRVGGFEEQFRFACGEDTDLAWRVKALGYGSAFAPEAVVVHDVRPASFALFLKERRRFADQVLLVRRHPFLRRLFYRRYFYQRSHVHALASLLLVAAAAAGAWPAAFGLPIVWFDRFRHARLVEPWPRRALVAAEMLVGDLWELAVFGYCSLRYRTVLI